jgi:tetratricopeptide (TPR) repeat protein
MGWVLHQRGSALAAAQHFQHAAAKLQDSPTVLYHYALNLFATGDKSQALKTLEKSLTLSEDYPERKQAEKLVSDWKKAM